MPRLCTQKTSLDLIKEKGLTLKKAKSRRYPTQTITDADYADIALLADTPTQAETLLHYLEKAARSIGLYVNSDKTEYTFFGLNGDIFTLEVKPMKLVEQFTYIGRNISSTERDINTRIGKAWTAIDRLSTI